tara:strand:+ start:804 stop:1532 length:729 start_codon:yes stop_codon:yes gene_type:complete
MSIFDMFKQPAQAPAPVPVAPANPGNLPDIPTIAVNPDGTPVVPALPREPESPLAEFKGLWETAPVDPNAPLAPEGYKAPTAEQIQTAVGKADFSKHFTPEQLAAVTNGGEGSQEALVALLNSVGQQSLAQSTMVSSQLSQKAMEAAIAKEVAKMPSMLRSASVTDHMKTANPLFENPAVKPIVDQTRAQLEIKYPSASNSEIAKMTESFILAMGAEFAPKVTPSTPEGETDWGDFFTNNRG